MYRKIIELYGYKKKKFWLEWEKVLLILHSILIKNVFARPKWKRLDALKPGIASVEGHVIREGNWHLIAIRSDSQVKWHFKGPSTHGFYRNCSAITLTYICWLMDLAASPEKWQHEKWQHEKWQHEKWQHEKWQHEKWQHEKWQHEKWQHEKWQHEKWQHEKWQHEKWQHEKWQHEKWQHEKWQHEKW